MILSPFPRSTSAYENILTSCDDEEPNDELVDPTCSSSAQHHNKFEEASAVSLEITIHRDSEHYTGMAFRLVGSRSRGIFISFIQSTSSQNFELLEGDQILKCNNASLLAMTVDQAASVLRYWMNNDNQIKLFIRRHPNGQHQMLKRRRQARLSMCIEQREQQHLPPSRTTIKMTSSKSAEVFRCYQDSDDSSDSRLFGYKSPRYVSFDTSTSNHHHQKSANICPKCQASTKMLYLHQISHGLLNNAFRFLTLSRSSYSLL